jgi:predicted transcriptional regulator
MRTTETVTISLPPAMVKQMERVRKREHRTRSELIREALRHYIDSRYPEVTPTEAELAAIRRGRAEIKAGRYITLEQLSHEVAPPHRKQGSKRARKTSR